MTVVSIVFGTLAIEVFCDFILLSSFRHHIISFSAKKTDCWGTYPFLSWEEMEM
jgi:hypothetical protein